MKPFTWSRMLPASCERPRTAGFMRTLSAWWGCSRSRLTDIALATRSRFLNLAASCEHCCSVVATRARGALAMTHSCGFMRTLPLCCGYSRSRRAHGALVIPHSCGFMRTLPLCWGCSRSVRSRFLTLAASCEHCCPVVEPCHRVTLETHLVRLHGNIDALVTFILVVFQHVWVAKCAKWAKYAVQTHTIEDITPRIWLSFPGLCVRMRRKPAYLHIFKLQKHAFFDKVQLHNFDDFVFEERVSILLLQIKCTLLLVTENMNYYSNTRYNK